MKWGIALILLVGMMVSLTASAEAPRPMIRVISLDAQRELEGELGRFTGTRLNLVMQLRFAKATVVHVDANASQVTELVDDRKTDLLNGKSSPFTALMTGGEGELVQLELSSRKLPDPEATEVRVKGSLAMVLGREMKSVESKGMPMKGGEKVPVGPYTLIVRRANVGKGLFVEITSNTFDVAGLQVTDRMGKAVPVKRIAATKLRNGDVRFAFDVARPAEDATVKVTYHDKLEKVTVPVDVKVVLGLGAVGKDTKTDDKAGN